MLGNKIANEICISDEVVYQIKLCIRLNYVSD